MILKFNLLPKRVAEVKPETRPFTFVKIYFIILSFLVITLISVTYNNYSKIKTFEKEKNEKQLLLNKYKNITKKVKELERENEEVKKRIEMIVNLKRNQGKNLKYLAEVIKEIKPEKLMLSNLKIQNDSAFLKGISLDMEFLAFYMQSLESKKEIIKNVNLKTAYQKGMGDFKLVEFEMEVKF